MPEVHNLTYFYTLQSLKKQENG